MLSSIKNPNKGISVTLNTWGTHQDGGNGMAHFVDSQFFGGNVGHASLSVTIPATQEGLDLIKKYCLKGDKTVIPFERTTQNQLDDNNKVIKQDVYTVYFSWWPGDIGGFNLRPNLNSDGESERSGVDVGPIDPRFTDPNNAHALNPLEQRTYHGILGSKKMNLSTEEISHITSLSPEQKKILTLERDLKEIDKKVDALKAIEKKIPDDKDKIKVEGSLLTLLDKYVNLWKNEVVDPTVLTKAEMGKIKEKLKELRNELKEEKDIIQFKVDVAKEELIQPQTLKLQDEVKAITTALENLPENERIEKIKQRDPAFSQQAWVEYEFKAVSEQVDAAQNISIFLQLTSFTHQKEKVLDILFDKKYPENMKNTKGIDLWRQYLPPEHKNITKELMTQEIYNTIQKNAREQKQVLIAKKDELMVESKLITNKDRFLHGDYGQFVTRGHAPDNQIQLPVSGLKKGEHQKGGLNIENMLEKMRALTEDKEKFDLTTKNCSVTTAGILAAGAEPELKSYFEKKAWGGFGNPQEVLNGAMQYENTIVSKQGQKSLGEKLSSINPLNGITWIGGKMLNAVVSPKTSVLTKIAAGIGVGLFSPIVACAEILKAVVNPKKTVQNCAKFMNYAWNNNSIFLKLCSLPVGIMAAALAIPAALQVGVQKAIIEPISNAINAKPTEQVKEPILSVPAVEHNKRITDKMVNINELDPVKAIALLKTTLQENANAIPVLSREAQKNVNQYISALDRNKPLEKAKIVEYDDTVKQILTRTNPAPVLPAQRFEPVVVKLEDEPNVRKSLLSSFENFQHQNKNDLPEKSLPEVQPDESQRSSRRLD